jgi:rhomboid protease GluP
LLFAVKNEGITSWQESIRVIDEADKLDIPQALKKRNALLRTYSELRLKSYEYHYKIIESNTKQYEDSLQLCITRIELVLEQLKQAE